MSVTIAELILRAETRQMKAAAIDIDKVTAAGAKAEASAKQLTTSMAAADRAAGGLGASAQASAANVQGMINSMTGVTRATAMNVASTNEWVASLNRQAQSFDTLRTSLDPLYASSKQYEMAVEQTTSAVQAGIVSQGEANRVLALAEARYLSTGQAARMMGAQTKASGAHVANLGFQLNDIGVMLAAGQNPLMLAVQQGTQINQVFAQMGGGRDALRGLAAGLMSMISPLSLLTLGVIAGGAALIQWGVSLLGSADKAEEAEAALDSLARASEAYMAVTEETKKTVSELALEFGTFAAEIQRTYDILQGVALERALDNLNVAIGGLDVSRLEFLVGIFQEGQGEIEAFNQNYNDALAEIESSFSLTGAQAETFLGQLNALKTADGPDQIVKAADELNTFLIAAYGSARDIPPELRDMVQRLSEAQIVAARVAANVDGSADAANRLASNIGSSAVEASWLAAKLGDAANAAAILINTMARAPGAIAAIGGEIDGIVSGLQRQNAEINYQIDQGITASTARIKVARDEAISLALANGASIDAVAALGAEFDKQASAAEKLALSNAAGTKTLSELEKAATAAGGAAKKSAGEIDKLVDEVERLNEEAAKGRTPFERYNSELERLADLKTLGLSDAAYSQELERMNEELANSLPMVNDVANAFGDFIARGLTDFKSFAQSILRSFTSMLSQMIATAARNRIVLSITGGASVAGTAAQAAGGIGGAGGVLGGGGIFGNLLGGFGTAGGGILGGLGGGTGLLGGLGNAVSGGLANVFSVGANAAAAGGGLMASIGAAIPIIGGLALVFGAFKKKVENLDSGIRVTIDSMDAIVETFSTNKTTRFFGLSKKTRTSVGGADPEVADPIIAAVAEIQTATLKAADALGIAENAFDGFATSLDISLKGLSEEQAMQAITEGLNGVGSAMAEMIPNLDQFRIGSETAGETLFRLSNSLQLVNSTFQHLERQLFDATMAGGDMASSLVELMGGMDSFAQQHAAYVQNFYSDGEQLQIAVNQLHDAFKELQVATPPNIAAFRALVEAQDLTTDAGRRMYAQLMQLSPAFAGVAQSVAQAASAAGKAVTAAQVSIPGTASLADVRLTEELARIAELEEALKASEKAARDLAKAAQIARSNAAATSVAAMLEAQQRERERIDSETLTLTQRLFQALGDTAALRQMELQTIDASNRHLLERIFAIQDEQAAMEAAARAAEEQASRLKSIADERFGIETRILELQGDTAALRARELEGYDESNRSLQQLYWSLLDAASAATDAAAAAEELARQQEAVADERYGLETRLLQLQGDTAALRARELELLNPANRALQEIIWGLEDVEEAIGRVTASALPKMEDFANQIAFDVATAKELNRLATGGAAANFNSQPASAASSPVEDLRTENQQLRHELMKANTYLAALVKSGDKAVRELEDLNVSTEAVVVNTAATATNTEAA